ncbi:MAG TPA: NAD(P)/FAD-dependent oxidoreductase [Caldilineaceae bacterium]|nr:NAD(P)/FAD-dependent oxidoreductase [Caldilineaceae bacterium]
MKQAQASFNPQPILSGAAPHVVVGGGLAGLTTAAYLAQAGEPVMVLERSRQLGGRAASQMKDGFILNQGPHALYLSSLGLPVLRELGVAVKGHKPKYSPTGLLLHHRVHTLPALLDGELWSWGDRWEFLRVRHAINKLDPAQVRSQTVRGWAEAHIRRPRVRELFYTLVRVQTYANLPDYQSMAAVVRQWQRAEAGGVWYLDGGWQTLVDGLCDLAAASGALIRTGVRVEAVTRGAAGPRVHLENGETVEAATVTLAVEPQVARRLLVEASRISLDGWLPTGPAVRAAVLDLGLAAMPTLKWPFALGVDRPLYYSVHSTVAALAPAGGGLVHLAKYLAENDEDPAAVRAELEQAMDLLQPGWRQQVLHQRFLPNMIVANAVDLPDGVGVSRARPVAPDYRNVFAAGDWVAVDAMLADAALGSGQQAAQLALAVSRAAAPVGVAQSLAEAVVA